MNFLNKYNIYKSYNYSKDLFKSYSKSYYLGAMLFPFSKFKNVCSFYGLVRFADNIVDCNNYSIEEKKEKLEIFKNLFFKVYDIEDSKYKIIENDNSFWSLYPSIFRGLFITIKEVTLERNLFERFFNSMEMDLEKYSYETYEDLEIYMDGSAAVVGEIMLKIMMHNDPYYLEKQNKHRLEYAKILGNAFQLTNFIRDINEDYNMNPRRIYLPQEDLKKYDIDFETYKNNKIDNNFKNFIKYQINKNNNLYFFSDIGISLLSHNDKLTINLSRILYSKILDKIEESNYELFSHKKIKVTFKEKLHIIYNNIGIINFFKILVNYILYSYFFIIFFILY